MKFEEIRNFEGGVILELKTVDSIYYFHLFSYLELRVKD